ncbi:MULTISPECIES: hypothetical protein [unclassified Arenibacter]|jgi:hypothetical protein|uniref:hypothetical protein n=1 Tax=unclassified Arenibacter TaxID=2615047 RepID=UPI000E3510CB|nr:MULTISPECIES: hypothetical protein [unclassified Arenibacter]MCM4165259.1 hypothetical protein [Arenibacter sp. A80]RFT55112.1 hypothetical protein D0S24_16800 [Arenibacter sp. P308M17]
MLYRLFAFIRFQLSSSNQHGVHSPFVYSYITKCLYTAPHYKIPKSHNILIKTMAYFNLCRVQLVPNNISLQKEITNHLKEVTFTITSNELIFIDLADRAAVDEWIVHNGHIANDTVVIVNGIYRTGNSHKLWKDIKELKQVKVTIDLFYCGLVFFRREQVKEHFKIRI